MTGIPPRAGPRPRTIPRAPHSQIDQLTTPVLRRELSELLVQAVATMDAVRLGPSMRAPPGTIGFHLAPGHPRGDDRCFLLGQEFAHVHVEDDGSLHAILPEPLRSDAIAAGWAEPHPLAGQPTVSPDTVMLYAPRDRDEAEIIIDLLRQSLANAKGQGG